MKRREKSKVLVIEDGNNSNLALRSILKIGQYSILSAFSNLKMEEFLEEQPEVILLTLPLKNRNGFEILKALKGDVRTSHIPVVVITKLNTQVYWEAAYRMGADAYLVVPNHYPYLLNKLNRVRCQNLNSNILQNAVAI